MTSCFEPLSYSVNLDQKIRTLHNESEISTKERISIDDQKASLLMIP